MPWGFDGCCCGCPSFIDRFQRDTLGAGLTVKSGSWSITSRTYTFLGTQTHFSLSANTLMTAEVFDYEAIGADIYGRVGYSVGIDNGLFGESAYFFIHVVDVSE